MNKLNQIIIFLFAGLFLFGCSDDDQEFTGIEGKDRFISSFTLKIDGISYDASIVGDKISIEVPYRVKLEGASVEYTLSEGATINPNPSKLQDWGTEWKFVVTSNTKESAVYYYSYRYADIAQSGSVTLKTQEEVDKFANTGINKINGNLVIGTMDGEPIENLNGLKNLREINNSLIINPSYKGVNLSGLEGLEILGAFKLGSQIAYDSSVGLKHIEFPVLKSITGDFIVNSTSVEKVLMPKLENVGEDFYIVSDVFLDLDVTALTNVAGSVTLEGGVEETGKATTEALTLTSLKNVGKNFTVQKFPNIQGVYNPELLAVGGLIKMSSMNMQHIIMNKLEQAGGIDIVSQYALIVEFPNLISCGRLLIDGAKVTQLNLSALKNMYGDMILCNLLIEELDISNVDFNSYLFSQKCNELKKIIVPKVFNGSFEFLPPGTKLTEFILDGAQVVNGSFKAKGYSFVESFKMPIEEIKGDMELCLNRGSVKFIKTVDFSKLKTIGGSLTIYENYSVPEIRFDELISIGTFCNLSTAGVETGLVFPKLKEIGSRQVPGMNYINTLNLDDKEVSSPDLEKVYGDLVIITGRSRSLLFDHISFPSLREISNKLIIKSLVKLNDVILKIDFSSLESVQSVSIDAQEAVSDFSAFSQLFTSGVIKEASQWTVTRCGYIPTFQDMMDGKYKPAE